MAVRITRVEIDSCGPVARFHEEMAPLTVVYGANERGKTTILENMVAALFGTGRETLMPSIRPGLVGSARVHVSGLGRRVEVFTPPDTSRRPGKRRRLEDLLGRQPAGLQQAVPPPGLFGLLVVRAGQTDIDAAGGGLDKGLLKGLLSRQRIYEQLAAALPGELAYTVMAEGRLHAQKRIGACKTHEEALQRLQALETLAEELAASLSQTGIVELRARQARLAQRRAEQNRARRHGAWRIAGRIRDGQARLARLDRQLLERLAAQVQEQERLKEELDRSSRKEDELAALEADSRWLEEAHRRWIQGSRHGGLALQRLGLGLCALFLLAALACSLWLPGLLPLALGLSLAALLLAAAASGRRPAEGERGELAALRRGFQERFGRLPATSADFAAARSELDRRLGGAEEMRGRRRRAEERLAALQGEIRSSLLRLQGPEDVEDGSARAAVRRLTERRGSLELEVQRLQERLQGLGVDESDYLEEDPREAYSRETEDALERETREVEEALRQAERQAAGLQQRLAAHLGPEFAGHRRVEELAAALEARRTEEQRTARAALASVIAGHVVRETLAEFRREEDLELERALNEPELAGLLARLTGRYDRLHLEGEQLLVGGDEELYDLREMSTGAREQILLALRLGLARALCGGQPLFLLLDDAFQHSDWRRRGGLVEQAVAVVREGWQLVYFTMDDDIRGRFVQAARALPAESFRLIEL